jgi:two-component system CheB/CheR fusion protein
LSGPDRETPLPAEEIDLVLAFVAALRGVDFRDYRREPIMRGVRERMQARGDFTVPAYLERLKRDPEEIERLIEALVVPCSSFFRDPPVWDALARTALPALLRDHGGRGLRAWCVGAATGEEAWTLAMLLGEACTSFTLLASDLDRRTLEIARQGSYPPTIATAVPERYRHFLLPREGQITVVPPLRESVRFAYHDLLGRTLAPAEAVVASFELVLARNLLIYFDRRLQQKALERIAATLEPGAVLVLGTVETMPVPLRARFQPFPGVDPDLRVFRYVGP